MRILDHGTNGSLNAVTIFLTRSEAEELQDSLNTLLQDQSDHHEHVNSLDFKKELIVSLYDSQSIDTFDDRSRRLIEKDE